MNGFVCVWRYSADYITILQCFHSSSISFSLSFISTNIFALLFPRIFVFFSVVVALISFLFLFPLQIDNTASKNSEIIVLSFSFMFTAVVLLTACELGGRMSIRFNDINDLIDQFDWYLLPSEIQRMLPIIIANAHEEVGFPVFGSYLCNRDIFKKVMVSNS